nr:GNAT family N-acetyltransferase [Clostridium guangxiense]
MEYVNINEKKYKIVIGNGKDDSYRGSFNALTEKTFGFNFENWYQGGYWKGKYIPYSLMDGDKVVSNVSANLMDLEVFGEKKKYIQLGTVMTDEFYKKQGLARRLMEKVLADYKDKSDLIYLFANDSAVHFYPKFGFTKIDQYVCTKVISKTENGGAFRKLNMNDLNDRVLVYNKAKAAFPIAQIFMCNNGELTMFYCDGFMKNSVYYVPCYDAVVVVDFNKDELKLFDIFCEKKVSADDIINCVVNENIKKVKLYFTPKETASYEVKRLELEGTLFVMGKDKALFQGKKFMFPELSHT